MTDINSPATQARTGFRPLRVVKREQETAQVSSFWLEPVEAGDWRDFSAGQFLSFRLPSSDARGKMLRNYSLASAPHERGRYQICVKRESATANAQTGQGSGYLHAQVQVGDVLHADGPRGNFVLKPMQRPVVMISAGIGVTPLVSMLKTAVRQSRHAIHFLHECESAASFILRRDVMATAAANAAVTLTVFDLSEGPGLHADAMTALLPDDCDVYLCGPTPFMQRAYAALRNNGIAPDRIAHEFFGPLIDLERGYQSR